MICDDIKHLIYSYVYKSQYRDVLNELINCCRLVNNDLRSAVETYTLIIDIVWVVDMPLNTFTVLSTVPGKLIPHSRHYEDKCLIFLEILTT